MEEKNIWSVFIIGEHKGKKVKKILVRKSMSLKDAEMLALVFKEFIDDEVMIEMEQREKNGKL